MGPRGLQIDSGVHDSILGRYEPLEEEAEDSQPRRDSDLGGLEWEAAPPGRQGESDQGAGARLCATQPRPPRHQEPRPPRPLPGLSAWPRRLWCQVRKQENTRRKNKPLKYSVNDENDPPLPLQTAPGGREDLEKILKYLL